jgi:hypothetical protein
MEYLLVTKHNDKLHAVHGTILCRAVAMDLLLMWKKLIGEAAA